MMHFLLAADHALFCFVNSHHAPVWDGFFGLITWLGNGWVITPLLLAITFAAVPRKKYKLFFAFAAGGMILSSVVNTQIKDAVQRPRPIGYFSTHKSTDASAVNGTYVVHVVGEPLACRSFPSGHANTAFCGACILAFFIGGWYWFAFVPAFLVAYSRVYVGAHFPLDAAAGAALAVAVMWCAYAGHGLTLRLLERK
jgi:membrane-associated phospholipid phosphatase